MAEREQYGEEALQKEGEEEKEAEGQGWRQQVRILRHMGVALCMRKLNSVRFSRKRRRRSDSQSDDSDHRPSKKKKKEKKEKKNAALKQR